MCEECKRGSLNSAIAAGRVIRRPISLDEARRRWAAGKVVELAVGVHYGRSPSGHWGHGEYSHSESSRQKELMGISFSTYVGNQFYRVLSAEPSDGSENYRRAVEGQWSALDNAPGHNWLD